MTPTPACSGDGCDSASPFPLHHIRHSRPSASNNSSFLRLCSSCVLKHHPGSFCSSCFDLLLDSPPDHRPPLVHCSNCSSVSHLSCLQHPRLSSAYLCPPCDSPSPTSFSYAPPRPAIDLRAAKILLSAARLSVLSMSRAAGVARAEAEKKVREAGVARKRAREMIERSLDVCLRERGRGGCEVVEVRKKAVRVGSSGQKRVQEREREREKWRRFSEPIKGYLGSDGVVKDEEGGIVENGV